MTHKPEDFYSTWMVYYDPRNLDSYSFAVLKVLPCLKGKPWDKLALALVHSLQPSSIRVTTGTTKCDASVWRVTVYINDDNIIQEISQEVEVGVVKELGIETGHDLTCYLYNHGFLKDEEEIV